MPQNLNPYWLVTDSVGFADDGSTVVVGVIPAKTLVVRSCIVVSTGFTADSPLLDLGDEDDEDEFVDNADVTEITAGAYFGAATDAFEGAWYPAQKNITLKVAGGTLLAGVAFGVLQCLDLSIKVYGVTHGE